MSQGKVDIGCEEGLLHRRLAEHASTFRSSLGGNMFNVAILGIVFSGSVSFGIIIAGFAILAAILVWRFRINRLVHRIDDNIGHSSQIYQQLKWNAAALGCFWGVAVGALLPIARPDEQMFLAILGSGMISAATITYRTTPVPARIFAATCASGCLVGLFAVGTGPALGAAALLASYVAVLFAAISASDQFFKERIKRTLDLAVSSETIRILLNDYEEQSSDWLVELDADGVIRAPSMRFAAAARRPIETLMGMKLVDLLKDGPEKTRLNDYITSGRAFRRLTVGVPIDGDLLWWSVSARPAENGEGLRGVVTDITAQRQAEEKVSYMAHYDGLTDLPNRFLFSETLYRALNRQRGRAALLYLDLDHFKATNDTLGHHIGDLLLQSVARRLETCVLPGEMIARLGGDEFAVLIGPDRFDAIDRIAEAIVDALNQPFSLDGHDVVVGCSIGIALAPDHADDAEKLLQNADLALYTAKAHGRNRYTRFATGMDESAQARRLLELDLRTSLGKDEMRLHYQPLIDIEHGATIGYEALLRWEHPQRGIVMPADFIPIAEETGMIVQLGEWVIRHALDEARHWDESISIAVNLSPAQMRSASLVSTIISALSHSGVAPHRLELEITESVLMHDSAANLETLHKLHDLGVRIALDDFGTGYSSLNYLRSFPFDKIKIDRCFVSEIDSREDCQAIVRSVVSLANSLGMTTTAEGVERAAQLDQLELEGCHQVQGFLFSQAVPISEMSNLRTPRPLAQSADRFVPIAQTKRSLGTTADKDRRSATS